MNLENSTSSFRSVILPSPMMMMTTMIFGGRFGSLSLRNCYIQDTTIALDELIFRIVQL